MAGKAYRYRSRKNAKRFRGGIVREIKQMGGLNH